MTYIEKLMSAVKFDDEMLTQEEKGRLREGAAEGIIEAHCPYMFSLLRKCGAKIPDKMKDTGAPDCDFDGACEDCWAQEIGQWDGKPSRS